MEYERILLSLQDKLLKLEEDVNELKRKMEKLDLSKNDVAYKSNTSEDIIEKKYGSSVINTINDFRNNMSYTPRYDKDTTKYKVDGIRYGKNRMVLAVVKKYMSEHLGLSADELMSVFDKSLQGSLGVIRTVEDAKRSYADCERRFFFGSDEIIHTTTDDCVVCTQWGKFNINGFIERARSLGIEIEEVRQ